MSFKFALFTFTLLSSLLSTTIPHCAAQIASEEGQTPSLCQTCDPGFSLSPSRASCHEIIANCLKTVEVEEHSLCKECNEGFALSTSKRLCLNLNLPGCSKISLLNGKCVACKPGFVLTDDQLSCLREIANCLAYQPSSASQDTLHCKNCKEGFYASPNETNCLRVPGDCETIDRRTSLCKACKYGFLRTDDSGRCLPLLANCLFYRPSSSKDDALSCRQCRFGFRLEKGACLPERPKIPIFNCKFADSESGRCQECESGFSLSPDKLHCYSPIDFCVEYKFQVSKPAVCSRCYKNISLVNNQCPFKEISNCEQVDKYFQCQSCAEGSIPSTDGLRCVPTLPNCAFYTKTSVASDLHFCVKCSAGYFMDRSGACEASPVRFCSDFSVQENRCRSCPANFRVTDDGLKCLPNIELCAEFMSSDKDCLAHVCVKCQPHAVSWKGKCGLKAIQFCLQQDKATGHCEICRQGYSQTDDGRLCLPEVKFCDAYAKSSAQNKQLVCLSCVKSFVLQNNVCVKFHISHCKELDEESLVCEKCESGFRLTDDHRRCLQTIPNCVSYAFTTAESLSLECRGCRPVFRLEQNACRHKFIPRCQSLDETTGDCKKCQEGFSATSDGLKCLPEINACLEYLESDSNTNKHVCSLCAGTHVLQKGKCEVRTIRFCEQLDQSSGTCKKCIEHFLPTDDGEVCLREVTNCAEYFPSNSKEDSLLCKTCQNGFLLKFNNCIKPEAGISHCAKLDETRSECLECETGFLATTDKLNCLEPIENCEKYHPSSVKSEEHFCLACKKNYVVAGRKCERQVVVNCKKYDEEGSCIACAKNYRLTDDRTKCLLEIKNCLTYQPSDYKTKAFACKNCAKNYEMVGKECWPINCENFSQQAKSCLMCKEGFQPTTDKIRCLPKILFCKEYKPSSLHNEQLFCANCEDGHRLSENKCPKFEIDNCEVLDIQKFICSKCLEGFIKVNNNLHCLPEITDCLIYKGSSLRKLAPVCKKCRDGFFLRKNSCIDNLLEFCDEIFDDGQKCSRCKNGFRPTDDLAKCLPLIENCLGYEFSAKKDQILTCKECEPGFDLADNKCVKFENCLRYDKSALICKSCLENFVLTSDRKKCLPEISRCAEYENSNADSKNLTCKKCGFGFQLIDKKCVPKFIRNCDKTNKAGRCDFCQRNFEPTSDGFACLKQIANCDQYFPSDLETKAHRCKECDLDFITSANNSNCLPEINGCVEYNEQKTKCLVCKNLWEISPSGDKCYKPIQNCLDFDFPKKNENELKCRRCHSNFDLDSKLNVCTSKFIQNCLYIAQQNDFCLKCKQGFFVTSDGQLCLQEIKNCENYFDSGKLDKKLVCEYCKINYDLKNNQCVKNQNEECIKTDDSQSTCEECYSGFVPAPKGVRCIPSIENCLEYRPAKNGSADLLLCKKCEAGFSLFDKGNYCEKEIQNCLEYNESFFFCVDCQKSFVLTSDFQKCIKEIPGCLNYEDEKSSTRRSFCLECEEGYVLKKGKRTCLKIRDIGEKMKEAKAGLSKKLECKNGWKMTTDARKCLPQIDFCQTYFTSNENSGFLTCEKCAKGFAPAFDGKSCAQVN